jgi:putative Holliday junction resolvase
MRVLGVDYGRRRIGLAVSDASATLARPWQTVDAAASPRASAVALGALVAAANADELGDRIDAIVVGLPRRLGGEDNDQTAPVREFASALGHVTGLAVALQDERLSSRAAEEALAVHERDWRKRKARLDAAAAAVILQDYLDQRARETMKK